MLLASLLVVAALALTYLAKTAEVADAKPLYLGELARAEQLIPYLQILPTPRERQVAARQVYDWCSLMAVTCRMSARSAGCDSVINPVHTIPGGPFKAGGSPCDTG